MPSSPPAAERSPKRPGRPRNRQIDAAAMGATLEVLNESGYAALTFEEVARRAGTTRPALYRRWPTRQNLVLDTLARHLGETPVPDTDCTLCDLGEGIVIFVEAFHRIPPDVLGPLLAECASRSELRTEFMTALFHPPRAAVERTLQRARARGDLREDCDLDLTLDLLGSLVHYRVLFDHAPVSGAEIERILETLLHGIAVDYEALVEHSRRLAGDSEVHRMHVAG